MNEVITILQSSGYQVTKNITISPNKEQLNSVSVYCIGLMIDFEVRKIKKILSSYCVSVVGFSNLEEVQIKFIL